MRSHRVSGVKNGPLASLSHGRIAGVAAPRTRINHLEFASCVFVLVSSSDLFCWVCFAQVSFEFDIDGSRLNGQKLLFD